jgi:hypothetical protein
MQDLADGLATMIMSNSETNTGFSNCENSHSPKLEK